MKTADFSFELPEDRIAQFPPEERGLSRLMVLDRGQGTRIHSAVGNLPDFLEPGTLLVFNNSKVRKARLYGVSAETGAKVEFLLLKQLDDGTWQAMVQRAKRRRPGSRYVFGDGIEGEITGSDGEFRIIRFSPEIDDQWLDRNGHIPLPPYIKREDRPQDSERYQTIYADPSGSAAAPTAGLHFTRELLDRLREKGIETAFVTLHVGLGTFLPVRAENIEDHRMHEELYFIGNEAADAVEAAKSQGRKVIPVGTTSLRTLESSWHDGALRRGAGNTSIFMYPGYRFKVAGGLFTNFHTPESTLLMLVSAFAGRDFILESYRDALNEGYRFFSYGDAMLIL
ncbi:tRNA preQ1(34) S-adenosylmethionine ribosyltransferase-isomerase QueA [Breznakiella homolactica]|uniref:S-adenosylmethionine:tRNA ribosyltransferase-isomerase n=1 Tax=Breznakiella homolactica TaxID=2798577 RepID=A0A7T7XKN7_9SPIR|nr:tRNA preQ1(34) S-adenosylmethionine ribosyltransferase-isomerase QueA [Breznakiella homolactica]QQO08022.1 tRNA preQ1(34) S-adenosylmethionine ribosyltransferase-isomerase QueA [Breznakiella homolactica]